MRPVKFNLILAFVLIGLSSVVTAQSATNLDFKVNGGEGGLFPILANGSGNAVEYAISDGSVNFMIDPGISFDNPVFCFDFSDEAAAVKLQAEGISGQVVLDSISLGSTLAYDLTSGVINFSPGSSVQCFFQDITAQNPQFGLFGELADNQQRSGESEDEGSLFNDSFAVFPELDVTFSNLRINDPHALEGVGFQDVSVSPGDIVTYDLVITNTGGDEANSLAYQEVFPASFDGISSAFSAALTVGEWICVDLTDTGACPALSGTGPIRFQGVTLPAGSKVVFEITREVMGGSEGQINLYAGMINGGGPNAESAAAEVDLDIVGEPVQLEFAQQPTDTTVGQLIDPPVTVEVVDSNGNRVTTEDSTTVALELYQNGTLVDGALDSGVVTSGAVSFDSLDTTGLEVGTGYQIKAVHGAIEQTISSRDSDTFQLL